VAAHSAAALETTEAAREAFQGHAGAGSTLGLLTTIKRTATGLLATVFKPENRYIGYCGLYPQRGADNVVISGEARLAFYLARPYWGRGLATEAGRAFIEYGFNHLGLSRIVAGANARNLASNRVLTKIGMVWLRSGEGGGNRWHAYELRNPSLDPTE
jgi:ribosomal-protein-alanine N-acetyltransferase